MIKQLLSISITLTVIVLLTATYASAGSIYDVVNPAPLPLNNSANGSFDEDHGVNYFLLSASSDGQYVISSSAGSHVFIRVYAAEPTEGGGVNIISYKNESDASYYALRAGMYKISVLNQSSEDTYSYTISNSFAPPTFSADIEPNDEFVQAASLVYGDVFGHQGYAYDAYGGMPVYNKTDTVDTWKITTEEDGYLVVDSALAESLDFVLYLYNADAQLMLSYSESDIYSNVEHQLAAGTYYIKTAYPSGFGSYMLSTSLQGAFLENDPEPNDERATAKVLAVGDEDTGHIGFATDARESVLTGYYKVYDTDDYWKITTAEDGVLTVATTANTDFDDGPFMHLYVYSAEGKLMQSNYNFDESLTNQASLNVAAGTYYVDVKLEEGYGSYLIASGLTPETLATDAEPNELAENATLLLDNGEGEGTDTGHLGYITDTKSGLNGAYNVYDTYDFWKIEYDEDGVLDLAVHLENDTDDPLKISFHVYNEYYNVTGSNIHYDNDSSKVDFNATLARQAGYVYVLVRREEGFGSYSISYTHTPAALAADDLVNDTIDDASTIPIGGIATGHLGFPKKTQDYNDYWRIDILKEGTLDITCVSEGEFGEGPVMYVSLHQDTPWLTSDMNYDNGDSVTVSYDVTPGIYYANVHYREGYGSYTLSVAHPSDEIIPVMILTETLPVATAGEEYSLPVEIDYGGEEIVSYELLVSPLWLNISNEGVLEGTPGNNDPGSEIPVTIKVFTSDSEDILETTIAVNNTVNVNQDDIPNAFHVDNPFPNPFNAEITISYSLPQAGDVRISVFNLLGQIVFDETFSNMSPGNKTFMWRGEKSGGNTLNSGVYFFKVASENSSYTRKALFIK
jgi:hypothetical protein